MCRLEELNLAWCDFTATHVKAAVNHVASKVTQLNLSGYRQNLQIAGKYQHGKPLSHYGIKQQALYFLLVGICWVYRKIMH